MQASRHGPGGGSGKKVSVMLVAKGLVRSFGRTRAVNRVDISVDTGEVVGLLGPNGAGKSTVFGMLAGLIRPDEGEVWLGPKNVTGWPLHRRVRAGLGFLPQEPSVFPKLSVEEHLKMVTSRSPADAPGVEELLEQAELIHLRTRRAGRLSGGERRRLEIARCLAMRPSIVMMDEPFAGVDPIHVQRLQAEIRRLASNNIGVLLTDHAAWETLSSCDRVVLLDTGTVQISGTPETVKKDPNAVDRYLGTQFGK